MSLLFSGEDPTGHRFEEYLNPLEEITKKGISLDRKKMWSRIALGNWGGETMRSQECVLMERNQQRRRRRVRKERQGHVVS